MFGKYRRLYNEALNECVFIKYESENRIHNLTLYLYWLEKNFPDIFEDMMTYFDGMAGYTGDKLIKDDLPEDFYFNN